MFGERNYYGIPEYMRDGLDRYIDEGIPAGGFLTAVFENDLMGALGKADDTNIKKIHDYGMFVYNQMPMGAHGSKEKVKAWIESGGLQGQAKAREMEVS